MRPGPIGLLRGGPTRGARWVVGVAALGLTLVAIFWVQPRAGEALTMPPATVNVLTSSSAQAPETAVPGVTVPGVTAPPVTVPGGDGPGGDGPVGDRSERAVGGGAGGALAVRVCSRGEHRVAVGVWLGFTWACPVRHPERIVTFLGGVSDGRRLIKRVLLDLWRAGARI